VALALDDRELPVRVQAALAITELVVIHDSVRDAVSPQVGKVVQDLLKLSDETDLDILNHSMEAMVGQFQNELLPVASQLTARLVSLAYALQERVWHSRKMRLRTASM
jgi:hypothetical protein